MYRKGDVVLLQRIGKDIPWADDKIIMARRLIREGATLEEMREPLGYASIEGVWKFLKRKNMKTNSRRKW